MSDHIPDLAADPEFAALWQQAEDELSRWEQAEGVHRALVIVLGNAAHTVEAVSRQLEELEGRTDAEVRSDVALTLTDLLKEVQLLNWIVNRGGWAGYATQDEIKAESVKRNLKRALFALVHCIRDLTWREK